MKENEQNESAKQVNMNKWITIGMFGIILLLLIIIVLLVVKTDKGQENKSNNPQKISNREEYPSSSSNLSEENIDTTEDNYISEQEALSIALQDADLQATDIYNIDVIYDVDVELDYKFGQMVYEVEFSYHQYEYEYYIDAESGEIIKSFLEMD